MLVIPWWLINSETPFQNLLLLFLPLHLYSKLSKKVNLIKATKSNVKERILLPNPPPPALEFPFLFSSFESTPTPKVALLHLTSCHILLMLLRYSIQFSHQFQFFLTNSTDKTTDNKTLTTTTAAAERSGRHLKGQRRSERKSLQRKGNEKRKIFFFIFSFRCVKSKETQFSFVCDSINTQSKRERERESEIKLQKKK